MTRTITHVYASLGCAQHAVQALLEAGVVGDQISLVVASASVDSDEATEPPAGDGMEAGAGIGGAIGAGAGLLAGIGVLAIPGIGPVVAAGWLVATAAGAVVGAVAGGAAGGVIASLIGAGASEERAPKSPEDFRRGGTLLTARVPDELEMDVRRILALHRAVSPAGRHRRVLQTG